MQKIKVTAEPNNFVTPARLNRIPPRIDLSRSPNHGMTVAGGRVTGTNDVTSIADRSYICESAKASEPLHSAALPQERTPQEGTGTGP